MFPAGSYLHPYGKNILNNYIFGYTMQAKIASNNNK